MSSTPTPQGPHRPPLAAGHRWLTSCAPAVRAAAAALALLHCQGGSEQQTAAVLSGEPPRFEGTGCAGGAELRTPDKEFSDSSQPALFEFAFKGFELAGGADGQTASAACTTQVALAVPAGVAVRLIGGEWSGEATLATPGALKLKREYRLASAEPLSREIDFDPGFTGTFFFKDDMRESLPSPDAGWSPCSAQPQQLSARATVTASASGTGTSAKVFFGRAFQLEQRPCSAS